jgi:DNA primase
VIPDEVVERVREEADTVSIIGEFVKLKRSGSSFRGPCPFHNGKNPNFSVSQRGGYLCFKCGEKGDVFTFVQKRLGLDFVESVKWVGARAGVEVTEVSRRADAVDPREPLWEVNAAAAQYFADQLTADGADAARRYLDGRRIGREDAERFGLGYAPRDGSRLRAHLASVGYDDERQVQAGLLVQRDSQSELRSRFRDRLMFPIADLSGHIVGFGGRVLGDGEPKYLNSAESEIFSKRKLLYGLHWAKHAIRKAERVILVEGYFDVIRLVMAGVEEVVAPLGTALTDTQAALVRKFGKMAYLLYDSDQAGLKATFRTGDMLLSAGVTVRVVSLPDGEDPDTFTTKAGRAGLERVIEQSVDVFDRKVQILERAGFFADLRRKREALDKLLPTIRVTADHIMRDLYIARTSEVSGISRELLERDLVGDPETERPEPPPRPDRPRIDYVRRRDRRGDHRTGADRAERDLVRIVLHLRHLTDAAAEKVGPEQIRHPMYQRLYALLAYDGSELSIEDLAAQLDPADIPVLETLLGEREGLDQPHVTLSAAINAIVAREMDERMNEIDRQLPLASEDEKDDLVREKQRLRKDLSALGRQRWKGFNSPRS